jgi:hypothetical protein
MLSVVMTENGHPVTHDLHGLKLPGGTLAHTLDGGKLFRRLVPLDVSDIKVNTACLQPALENEGGRVM